MLDLVLLNSVILCLNRVDLILTLLYLIEDELLSLELECELIYLIVTVYGACIDEDSSIEGHQTWLKSRIRNLFLIL